MVKKRQRRIQGEGAVYRRKSDGRWVGSFKAEGMDKRKYVYARTEKEALEKLKQAMFERGQGTRAGEPDDQKVGDYLADWFENVHKPTIYITTYMTQRTRVYNHLIPHLGQVELRSLTAMQVQKLMADLGERGLAPGTIRNVYDILHTAIDNAVKWKLVPENVCNQVTLPKRQKRKKQLLAKEQIIKLIEVANTHKMEAFIKLALMTGLRHGEMLALRWSDIDFETHILSVVHNLARVYTLGYTFIEGEPKTEDGTRKIILPQFVVDALKAHREYQQAQRKMQEDVGGKWVDKDLVFCTRTGGYVDATANLKRFHRVLKEAGLPETMRVHDLRHNVATFLANVLKYPPQFIQALLGHSDIAITLGMYVEKVDPETLRPMMDELNDLFGGKSLGPTNDDLRRDVIAFLINVFHYPKELAQALLRLDPDALRQVMNELNDLLGWSEGE